MLKNTLKTIKLLKKLFLFHMHWCFSYTSIYMRVYEPLGLELDTAVSCHVSAGNRALVL